MFLAGLYAFKAANSGIDMIDRRSSGTMWLREASTVCMYVYVCVCACVCMCVYIYMYMYMCMYI